MVVIEHNLDVIKTADWVIDLGPGGGVNGGRIIAEGPPETDRGSVAISATGQYLKPILERAAVKPKVVRRIPGEGRGPVPRKITPQSVRV